MTTDHSAASRPLISVVTPCFNEEGNVREMYEAIRDVFAALPEYRYEHLFIDNASRDGTARILRTLATTDRNVKVILNARNFGHVRSGYHALLQVRGDAVIALACDFQDPPALIPEFLRRWSEGAKIVLGIKESSDESGAFYALRDRYYRTLARIADIELVRQSTGFGCFDQSVIEALRRIDDPYPYFRGLLAEIGHEPSLVPFRQPERKRGISSQNFYTLYDLAFLGIVNHSKVPLRMATMAGFGLALLSLLVAFGYLGYKLLFWSQFSVGIAPILIGFFFLTSVQLFFIGILGEYIGSIYTQVRHHPHVFEKERINF
ncbi:MAG: glycosyltransferase family 2 protein [Gemmatimonadetes bacterium]|nr:glycosyltransferase family 2 protein [Gemmatimonadota bacterium]